MKGETNAENEQETETRMVAVPEPPGTALLQQLVQAVHPQLQSVSDKNDMCDISGTPPGA